VIVNRRPSINGEQCGVASKHLASWTTQTLLAVCAMKLSVSQIQCEKLSWDGSDLVFSFYNGLTGIVAQHESDQVNDAVPIEQYPGTLATHKPLSNCRDGEFTLLPSFSPSDNPLVLSGAKIDQSPL
jgi:hypothetical protein